MQYSNHNSFRFLRVRYLVGFALLVTISIVAIISNVPDSTAAPEKPSGKDRRVSLLVTQILQRQHVGRHKQALNDTISRRALKNYLETLDPYKLYFYQSDIDQFNKNKDKIDNQLKVGDISFGYEVFNVFLKRMDQRIVVTDKILNSKFDFAKDETIYVDRKTMVYAKNAEEAADRWRKQIKYELLDMKAGKKEKYDKKKALERLTRRYHSFAKRMKQYRNDDILEMYLTAVTTSFDPHTTYMSPTSLENFMIEMRKQLDGIGASLMLEDGYTVINRIIPGGAADKQGDLKAKDRIIGVGQGKEGEIVDVVDQRLSDVVNKIRGKAGTIVRLELIKGGQGDRVIINITRAKIELTESIARSVIFDAGKKKDGTTYKIGVINLPSFYMDMEGARKNLPNYRSTTRDCRKILKDFNAKKVDAVVLDLRRNGGGSLTEAINLTGLFIDKGAMVQVKGANGVVRQHNDEAAGTEWDGPLVVLESKFSASASEILAGAIQDYNRGIIVGDKSSHGKGTVQTLLDVGRLFLPGEFTPNLGALKITIQQFYRPGGDSTQLRGVLSDVELPSLTTHLDVGEGDLDYALDFDKVPTAKMINYDMRSDSLLKQLITLSKKRVTMSKDFQKVAKNITLYLKQKKRKSVSLVESVYMAERKELNANKAKLDKLKEQNENKKEVVKRDFYFNEVLDVTVDYIKLLAKNKLAMKN